MACPYFVPEEPAAAGAVAARRTSLGIPYSGHCSQTGAPGGPLSLCNRGYARGFCEHFPAGAPADAIRFSLSTKGSSLSLVWILERDHTPLEHGLAACANGHFEPPLPEGLEVLARAFLRTQTTAKHD